MRTVSLVGSKVVLAVCNFLLLTCGFLLAIGGMLILFDSDRLILSKLLTTGQLANMPHPLLYYISIGLSLLGLVIAATGILGCWASCLHNYCLLSFYFVIVMLILIGECAIYTIAWAWPNCMGIGLDMEELVKSLQINYGAEGQEQFTAAVDLVQTMFSCCGIESANEYDTSLWRLQDRGPALLAIPLSCCKLGNANQSKAYLNPEPINLKLCQALEKPRHQGFRHVIGCKGQLEQWYRSHYVIFLAVGFVIVLIEFIVLLSTILMCSRIYHHNQEARNGDTYIGEPEPSTSTRETTFKRHSSSQAYSNETYAATGNLKEHVDRA